MSKPKQEMEIGVAIDAASEAMEAIKQKWKTTPSEAPYIEAFALTVGIAALQYATTDRQKIKDIVFHALDGAHLAVMEDHDPMRVINLHRIDDQYVELAKSRKK